MTGPASFMRLILNAMVFEERPFYWILDKTMLERCSRVIEDQRLGFPGAGRRHRPTIWRYNGKLLVGRAKTRHETLG